MQTRKLVSFFLVVFLVSSLILLVYAVDTYTKHTIANADDGYWYDVNWYPTNSYVLILHNAVTPHSWDRFTLVNITHGDVIDSAKISFEAQGASNAADGVITIQAFDEDNCSAPTSIADYNGKTQTSAAVTWTPTAWVLGTWYDTPSLTDIVQEIIDRADWVSGNSICFALDQTTIDSGVRKDSFPFEAGAAESPILTITYHTPSGQNLTFGLAENLFPSSTNFVGKELGYLQTGLILPNAVVSMSKAIGGVITEFLSTNSIYPTANLLFNKELAFWKYDNLFNSATSTMTKAIKLTLFELFEFVKLHASNIMLPGWTALTIEIAVAIGVLALVLAICGISLVVLRRRRE